MKTLPAWLTNALTEQELRVLNKTADRWNDECKLGKKQGRAYIENITPIQRAVIKKTVAAAVEAGDLDSTGFASFAALNLV